MYYSVVKNGQYFQLRRKYKEASWLTFFETNED